MTIEVMKQALEVLEQVKPLLYDKLHAIAALRQAIEKAEKKQAREPKKWVEVECPLCGEMAVAHTHPVLTTPQPKREWVGLTPTDIADALGPCPKYFSEWTDADVIYFARTLDAKLKEKNA